MCGSKYLVESFDGSLMKKFSAFSKDMGPVKSKSMGLIKSAAWFYYSGFFCMSNG